MTKNKKTNVYKNASNLEYISDIGDFKALNLRIQCYYIAPKFSKRGFGLREECSL